MWPTHTIFKKTLSIVMNKCVSLLSGDDLAGVYTQMPVYQAGENGLMVCKRSSLVLIFFFLPAPQIKQHHLLANSFAGQKSGRM